MLAIDPPQTSLAGLDSTLQRAGVAVVGAGDVKAALAGDPGDDSVGRWAPYWNDLPLDAHLRDHGRYRRRRHGCFVVDDGVVAAVPHRAHWQPLDYNALHGGLERWFEPLAPALVRDPAFEKLLRWLGDRSSALRGARRWFVEAHAFRIETTDGLGRPTPEGAHRDGVDLVAVLLVARHAVRGGETRVFDVAGPGGTRFTLTVPGTTVLLDDARVVHETTPIQPVSAPALGYRDTLVVTFRAGSFQAKAP